MTNLYTHFLLLTLPHNRLCVCAVILTNVILRNMLKHVILKNPEVVTGSEALS